MPVGTRPRTLRSSSSSLRSLRPSSTYADRGLYNSELGVMNYDSVHKTCTNARPQLDLLIPTEYYRDGAFHAPGATRLRAEEE